MAYGKRIYTSWKDLEGTLWTIDIYEDTYTGDPALFVGSGNPMTFHFGPASDLFKVIKSIECSITLIKYIDEDFTWLITDDDRKIKIIVTREATVWYTGFMIAGQYTDDLKYVTTIEITFNDQISLLNIRPFESAPLTPYTGRINVLRQVLDALNNTGILLDINIASNLFELTMDQDDDKDALTQASVNCDLWLDQDFKSGDCRTVIEKLLKSIQCRIHQANGEWWICRIKDLQSTNIDYRKYLNSGAYSSNGTFSPQLQTGKLTTPKFLMINQSLMFNPEWGYRELLIDHGLRNPVVNDLTLDNFWLDSSTHKTWTNDGGIWHWETSGYVHGDTGTRTTLDVSLLLKSPPVAVTSGEKYSLTMRTGQGKNPLCNDTCQIEIVLIVGTTDTYAYDEDKAEWVAFASGNPKELKSITFQKIPNTWEPFPQQSVDIAAPPENGYISIRVYAPYNNPLHLLDRPNHFYIGELKLMRVDADSTDPITDGFIHAQSVNLNAHYIPDPDTIYISDCGLYAEYLGGISVNTTGTQVASSSWVEKGEVIENTLEEWIYLNWFDQYRTAQMNLEATFYGNADFHNVIKIKELGDALFIWDEVEYDVKHCIWSGNLLQLKAPTAVVKSAATLSARTINKVTDYVVTSGGSVVTSPGGTDGQLQFKSGGDFDGTTEIVWDGTRLLKGGTLPLIEYHSNTETVASGEQTVTFTEPFLTGDDYVFVPPILWGIDTDGNVVSAVPYTLTETDFKINFDQETTFSYLAIIKR